MLQKSIGAVWNKIIHGKSLFYTLIVLFFCITDQRRGSAPGEVQFIFVNLAGVAVCLLMFSAYKWKDFIRLPYLIWTVIFIVGAVLVTYLKKEQILYQGQWNTALLNVWLIGLLMIRLFIRLTIEKQTPAHSKKAMLLFLGFMIWACLSGNDALWPWWYLILFGMLYLTKFTEEERQALQNALPNGIILSFFVIQGLAFMFRPYDAVRYMGLYANPNINGLFYSMVYCAFIGKYCSYYMRDKEVKYCRFFRIILLLFCGAMWSFVCFTMCRSAMLSMFLVTACAGIYCLCKAHKKTIRDALGMIGGLVLCIVLCAPVSYCAVRYLPPLFHHPIWFQNEYLESKVHSWDPIDSPKYVTWEQVLEGLLGRFINLNLPDFSSKVDNEPPIYIVSAEPDKILARLTVNQTPLSERKMTNSVNIREGIYKFYFENLNFTGHKESENGVQLTEDYFAPHAHNLFLQMAFSFGIPAGLLFILWIFYCAFTAGERAFGGEKDVGSAAILLFYINIVVFGMFEIVWRTGQLPFTLLFVLPALVFANPAQGCAAEEKVVK